METLQQKGPSDVKSHLEQMLVILLLKSATVSLVVADTLQLELSFEQMSDMILDNNVETTETASPFNESCSSPIASLFISEPDVEAGGETDDVNIVVVNAVTVDDL